MSVIVLALVSAGLLAAAAWCDRQSMASLDFERRRNLAWAAAHCRMTVRTLWIATAACFIFAL